MYSEYKLRPISSHPVTTRTEKCSSYFQQAIEEVFKGLDGCVAYQDDIMLFGVTEAELRKRYNAVKERLVAKNFAVKTRAYHSRQRYPSWALKFHRKV